MKMANTKTIITRLKKEALEATTFRGHQMSKWQRWTPFNYVTHCISCSAEAQVLSDPAPNQIDIGGEAVALNCPVN